jgi:CheY-like chemotaxis protein
MDVIMNILLVEDDSFFQNFYSKKLLESKFRVEIAGNGSEALMKMKESRPDVILLDLIMPVMDGFQVLEMVSKDESLKTIPILVFSTLGQEEDIEKAKRLGATDYVNKTFFDFDNLLAKIQAVVQH